MRERSGLRNRLPRRTGRCSRDDSLLSRAGTVQRRLDRAFVSTATRAVLSVISLRRDSLLDSRWQGRTSCPRTNASSRRPSSDRGCRRAGRCRTRNPRTGNRSPDIHASDSSRWSLPSVGTRSRSRPRTRWRRRVGSPPSTRRSCTARRSSRARRPRPFRKARGRTGECSSRPASSSCRRSARCPAWRCPASSRRSEPGSGCTRPRLRSRWW